MEHESGDTARAAQEGPSGKPPSFMQWLARDVVGPLVLNPLVPFEPRLAPPEEMPSRGCVSVRQHFLARHESEHADKVARDSGQRNDDIGEGEETQKKSVRVVSLNMEMGKRMGDILADMVRLQPDVILLQEVDLCCPRSGNVDCAGEIAQELGMACVFACEVENPHKFPGEFERFEAGGRQGNAILSRFPVKSAWPVLVTCRNRSRRGHTWYKTHAEAAAVLAGPFGDLLCYSVHFDPHSTGVEGRIAQYFEVLDDARLHYSPRSQTADPPSSSLAGEEDSQLSSSQSKAPYALIAGDFNTVITGIARLTPSLGWTKGSWWSTLGWTEAEWFDVHGVQRGNAEKQLDFTDPFDKKDDITFCGLGGLYQAKLDWCLVSSSLSVTHKEVGPTRSCSDHNWICIDAVEVQNQ